jgi:hypothetical protein
LNYSSSIYFGGRNPLARRRVTIRSGDSADAESLTRKAVVNGPGEEYPLAVLVEALHPVAKKEEAQIQFTWLRALANRADLDSPVFDRLRPIARELNLPADWHRRQRAGALARYRLRTVSRRALPARRDQAPAGATLNGPVRR